MRSTIILPSEDVRETVEALLLRVCNSLVIARADVQGRFDNAADGWNPIAAMAASRDMQFLDRVYEQALDLLRLTAKPAIHAPALVTAPPRRTGDHAMSVFKSWLMWAHCWGLCPAWLVRLAFRVFRLAGA